MIKVVEKEKQAGIIHCKSNVYLEGLAFPRAILTFLTS